MEQKTGTILNIQRFSIHDGPGIRTTVFFKGCNLRCQWCHNPESQVFQPQKMLYRHKCVDCGACRRICEKAFSHQCDNCGKCLPVCRHSAREIAGSSISAEALMDEIKKDLAFYENSGGGVTFSGGEPLLQPVFLETVLRMCKNSGIHTAIETAGNIPWETLERLLPLTDLFLYDLKAIDSQIHQVCTGVSNDLILRNAQHLKQVCPEKLLFRMPVIPGYNDSQIAPAAVFADPISLELLPYHRTGMGKYEALGIPYALEAVQCPSLEVMRTLTAGHKNVFCEENMV